MAKDNVDTAPNRLVNRELEALIMQQVEEVSLAIDSAKHVDQVICALHSLAARLFPIDSSIILGGIDQMHRSQVLSAKVSCDSERDEWKHAFYHGAASPAMYRILIYNVTSHWLSSFPPSVCKQIYDSFFVECPPSEVIQTLVPSLKKNGITDKFNLKAIYLNIERLLVLCFLENDGVRRMVLEFGLRYNSGEYVGELTKTDGSSIILRVAQLLVSIPDKASLETLPLLSSHSFLRRIVIQLLDGAEERALGSYSRVDISDASTTDGSLLFVGEAFSRICRRGSADILADEMIPRIINLVRSCLSTNYDCAVTMFEKTPKSMFWFRIMEAIKDRFAVERLSETLLRQLSTKGTNEMEAYWVLWVLFNWYFKNDSTMRAMFVDKFMIWKVFPVCCLRWIIQFSLLEHAPENDTCSRYPKTKRFFDVVQHLVTVWSKRDFVQSARVEQQAYITAAVGLCLERMTNEELETTQDVLSSILQGVTCRLESPIHLIRKMGSSIALAFSRVVDPANPLFLDDICCEEIDWEFGLISITKEPQKAGGISSDSAELKISQKHRSPAYVDKKHRNVTNKVNNSKIRILEVRKGVPDESIGPLLLNNDHVDDEDDSDDESKHSETSSDSSLQPYDISDDDADLQKRFSQLADVTAALRKSDDPDGVAHALDVAEKLIRASPDELHHSSGDLVRALVHVRCSDIAVEGHEESTEESRQNALVALIVTCPFESLDVITKLLYSPKVDVSQRIIIIDVMTEAAQELSDATVVTMVDQSRSLISSISESRQWFVPSHHGPFGAGPWKGVEEDGALSWAHRYERILPCRPGQVKKGKSRRWSLGKMQESQPEQAKNRFPLYAAAFMLPIMQGYDKRSHGVDFLNRDFIVLGKLIHMLGVCMKCIAMHPEASVLASHLLDMLKSRDVAHHAEAYVRRSVLFAASSILIALHPSFVASALIEGNHEISDGLEWIRTWAFHIAESDPDAECSTMAMRCLQLHSEMALQTSRTLETAQSFRSKVSISPSKMKDIIIPSSNWS